MKITVLTLFPEIFKTYLSTSIIGRASKRELVEYEILDIRSFATDKHQVVDDRPFGGGVGMVLKADVLATAVKSVKGKAKNEKVILTSASGKVYNQKKAQELVKLNHLILVCGHYEGVDQRFIDKYVTEELSVGDYVLTGGELPALTIIDSVVRLIPGVLTKPEAILNESFFGNLLEHPQYTRPNEFEGKKVPEVLLSGNHQQVDNWRHEQSIKKTQANRPDLLPDH